MKIKINHSKPSFDREEEEACSRVLQRGHLAKGPECEAFTEELAAHFNRRHVILTSCGASALHLSLLALGVKPGELVQIPSYVCTALLNSVHMSGAEASISDCPQDGFMMSPTNAESNYVIYPQMFGVVQKLNFPDKVQVIEDCAMALGTTANKQGVISTTSFYATKMMATGQGGAIFTDREDTKDFITDIMKYDNNDDYKTRYNYDMPDLAAAIGRVQLIKLKTFLKRRAELACLYDDKLTSLGVIKKENRLSNKFPDSSLFRYWVNVANLNECIEKLAEKGVESKSPVYKPIHQYLNLPDNQYPHACLAQQRSLSLPFYPDLKEKELEIVCETLASCAKIDRQ